MLRDFREKINGNLFNYFYGTTLRFNFQNNICSPEAIYYASAGCTLKMSAYYEFALQKIYYNRKVIIS